ncbi:MAG: hypothetical protein U1D66_04815 [Erythrobacter sp.]|nr:hypothetical protein [Erythrobacter sp.]
MIDHLALAALAAGAGVDYQTDWPSLIMMAGFITLHAIIPLVGGMIYGDRWRILFIWVGALAGASYVMHTGQELLNGGASVYGTDSVMFVAVFTLVPAFGAATIGIIIRKLRHRHDAERPAPEAS